ncbi:alpha/beta hydrolase [Clostridium aestuarii]|uniref:Alpha/beta hydrolase n=1 Tax=Clostridium aestuarii TaxID=338193 RepID=A0ABT4CXZ2_9CLOT|nr:alpha/beta hydrolase [Clostridium aestuarii]MCY6482975.1 alpha/beta hydrolase [Clostridium aestuarii]
MSYFLTSDNVKLYYETCGEGSPIVLIHGWSCSHLHFRDQIKELSKKYKVAALDLRGHGLSEVPNYGLTISRFAKDVKDFIEYLKLDQPSLIGWSMGTTIIFDFVRQFGCQNINKLCLIDMTPKIITDDEWNLGLYGQFSHKDNLDTMVGINTDWNEFSKVFVPAIFAKTGCKDKDLQDWAFNESLKNSPHVMARMWIDMSAQDHRDMLSSITVPTLITHGGESALYLKENSEYLNKNIPDSKLVTFDGCGHGLQLEDPEKFNKELMNFIG